jgi:imidazolonepropionase-like amidohydrolase
VTSGGAIAAIGKRADVPVPDGSRIIDCTGKIVVAGFWNSHVHFTEPAWNNTANAPAGTLDMHMRDMLTRWGFTTVWDLGSDPVDTLPLRRRIDSGEIPGPGIFLAGPIFPEHGHPVYLPPDMQLPEAATPEQAAQMARNILQLGLNGVKLFTGSFMGVDKPAVNMAPAIAKAAVDVAHAQGRPVFAHPHNGTGVDAVLASGVDVLAHTIQSVSAYTPMQLAQFKSQGTALIPTLSLLTTLPVPASITERLVQSSVGQLKAFSENGGPVLFGTDVGYIRIYDTSLEFELMHRALSEQEVLASLTTNPASYFKAARKGRVETGFDADLAVLDRDPMADVRNLASVAYTIRAGRVIYQRP